MVVEEEVLVFMVFSQDNILQCRLPPRNAFLSASWSRLWTIRPRNASLSGLLRRALSLHPRKRSSERILEQITVPSSEERSSQRIEEQLVDISSGGLSPGVFSASSAVAADEGPAGRGSGMGKARFAGEVALRALSSRGKAGFAREDAPRGSSSRGKAGSTGDDAPRGSSSLPRACEPRLGGLPAQGRHDEWVCVVDVENGGEYFWNRLDNSMCWRLPRGVKHRWCLLPSGLYRDVVTQVNYRVLPPL